MKAEFINPFLNSLLEVLKTMASIELTPQEPHLKTDRKSQGDVSGIIGMVGPQTKGSFSISLERSLALAIYANMLGEEVDDISDEVTDMVGEITNMVTGGAKRILGEKGYQFDMATPTVISGKGHEISHKVDGPRLAMDFKSEHGRAIIEICFDN
jgi:chemotaxis protein CheX